MRFTDKNPRHIIERSNAIMVLECASFKKGTPESIEVNVSYTQLGALKTCLIPFGSYIKDNESDGEISFGETRAERPWIDLTNARDVLIEVHGSKPFDFKLFFETKY